MVHSFSRILLGILMIEYRFAIALNCYFNECGAKENGVGGVCSTEGQGYIADCSDSPDTTAFCFDSPVEKGDDRLGFAGCQSTNKTIEKVAGCGPEMEELTGFPNSCVCFDDLCNNHFKGSATYLPESEENFVGWRAYFRNE